MKYDFSGWATKNDMLCTDGRTIRRDAFKECDGKTVPLVWNHQHNSPDDVLGHALLENRKEGVYAYCTFNDSETGRAAKLLVSHGDVKSLSIAANQLRHAGKDVVHGRIFEVSLVHAGANEGAFIDTVLAHGDDSDGDVLILGYDEKIELAHSSGEDGESEKKEEETSSKKEDEASVQDVVDSMTEAQKNVMYGLIALAREEGDEEDNQDLEHSDINDEQEGGNNTMKHNIFDQETGKNEAVLTHADMEEILTTAKLKSVGSFRDALTLFAEEHTENEALAHGIDEIELLFPEYKDLKPGAPELISRDQGWVSTVMNKTHKAPFSRIRTRQADMRSENDMRALGYGKKGTQKYEMGNIKLLSRTTDPQTVYVKDHLEKDDITDITDFDVVQYIYGIMRQNLNEEIATAILIGDGREDADRDKIHEEHIRSIWHDDDLYSIHYDVDIAAARKELQGTNTNANFGENYIYAEAIITAALYSREKYKGSGTPDFYCTPHLLNVMLLARDLNGRRIYNDKTDLAAALNVSTIHTVEQFEGKKRTDKNGKEKKLLGIFVNLADYQVGCTKGGEISRFSQFDIDFNREKYLLETRLSGALTRVWSAICLEEPVAATSETNPPQSETPSDEENS